MVYVPLSLGLRIEELNALELPTVLVVRLKVLLSGVEMEVVTLVPRVRPDILALTVCPSLIEVVARAARRAIVLVGLPVSETAT